MPKPNIADVFKIQEAMMKISASWPKGNSSLFYKVRGSFLYMLNVILIITMLMEAYKNVEDIEKLSEVLYLMTTVATNIFKHATFFMRSKHFIRLIEMLKDPMFTSYPDDLDYFMANTINRIQLITRIFRNVIIVGATLLTVSPAMDHRSLPYSFSYDLGNYKTAFYVFQSFTSFVVGWNNVWLDSLPASLISIASCQLAILEHKIIRIGNKNFKVSKQEADQVISKHTDSCVTSRLKQCVQHHLAIIELIELINEVFSFAILIQFLGSIIVMCNTLFHFLLVTPGSMQFFFVITYLIAVLLQLFLYCWFGNDVVWKSVELSNACYLSNWHNYGTQIHKYLLLIMGRSQRPLTIKIFKFSFLSLVSYLTILRWSYSYFALLVKLTSEINV